MGVVFKKAGSKLRGGDGMKERERKEKERKKEMQIS